MSLADRIVVMEGGRIRQVGTPAEVYDHPADLFVATFVGSPGMNFIPGEVAGGDDRSLFVSRGGQVRIEMPRPARSGAATIGIRPEHVLEDPRGQIAGRVLTEEYLGNGCNVHLETGCGRLIMRDHAAVRARARGSELRLWLDPDHISVFDAATEERL